MYLPDITYLPDQGQQVQVPQQTPETCCMEDMITSKLFIRPLTIQHHTHSMLCSELEYMPLGEDTGGAERLILMPRDEWKQFEELGQRWDNLEVGRACALNDSLDV